MDKQTVSISQYKGIRHVLLRSTVSGEYFIASTRVTEVFDKWRKDSMDNIFIREVSIGELAEIMRMGTLDIENSLVEALRFRCSVAPEDTMIVKSYPDEQGASFVLGEKQVILNRSNVATLISYLHELLEEDSS